MKTDKRKWYVGARRTAPYVVFRSDETPTDPRKTFGATHCFGPYAREAQAVETAMYQNYGKLPLYGYERGPGWTIIPCYSANYHGQA